MSELDSRTSPRCNGATAYTSRPALCEVHPGCRPHPLYAYYDGCRDAELETRILVIGREPNADQCVGESIGPYPLKLTDPDASGAAFWTWSHHAISRAAKIHDLDLWQLAKRHGTSPIAYADASPWGRVVRDGRSTDRVPVPDVLLADHARRLLALPQTRPAACPVVLISGRLPGYRAFYDVIIDGFRTRGTLVAEGIPFFGQGSRRGPGGVIRVVANELSQPGLEAAIQRTVREWLERHAIPVARQAAGRSRRW